MRSLDQYIDLAEDQADHAIASVSLGEQAIHATLAQAYATMAVAAATLASWAPFIPGGK